MLSGNIRMLGTSMALAEIKTRRQTAKGTKVVLTSFDGKKSFQKASQRPRSSQTTVPMMKAIRGQYNPNVRLKRSFPANILQRWKKKKK